MEKGNETGIEGAVPLSLAGRISRRARGLLLSEPSEGMLLLMPCSDVHTAGMRHKLDVAFVDATGLVLEAHRDVGPFRRLLKRGAAAVVERFSSCSGPWFEEGDRVGMVRLEGGRP